MYRQAPVRITLLLVVGLLAATIPPPYPDRWFYHGIRDLAPWNVRYLPLAWCVAMILADVAGSWLPRWSPTLRRPAWSALLVVIVAFAVLWTLRVPQWLGDYSGLDRAGLPWFTIEPAEPLGAFTSYYTLHWGTALGLKNSTSVGLVVTTFGASAVGALFLWSRIVSPEWPLVFAMLISSGFMVLFCGYPEKGTPKSVALSAWYIYFATVAIGQHRAVFAAAASATLALAGLMHGSALCWLPAHGWYVWRTAPWRQLLVGVIAFIVPLIATLLYVRSPYAVVFEGPWGNIAAPWQWFKQYCITNCEYDFWSVNHFVDILNCLLALSPAALLCLPEALANASTIRERWLALGSLGWLFLSIAWFPVFGYLSDWDIFAGTPLVISCFTIVVGTRLMPAANFRRLACAWIAGSLIHTASFWWLFHTPL